MNLPFQVTASPAPAHEIVALSACLGPLPDSYLAFLSASNGAELGVHDEGGDCLALWSARELPDLNEAYGVQQWFSELLVIGSDGGDHAIGFLRDAAADPESWPVVRVPFGALASDEAILLAAGFQQWQAQEFRIGTPS